MTCITRSLIPFALILALGACQKETPAPTPARAPAPAATPAAPPPAVAQPAPAQAMAPAAADAPIPVVDSVGVPECDAYLTKYMACISSKVPESARAMLSQSINQTRDAWKAAAMSPAGKSSLAVACNQAREATKAQMSQYGCTDF